MRGLDEEQEAAVTSRERRLLVLAGPGSGKTRVLTRRVVHLVEQGVDPARVLAVTFTNKAAKEMRGRLVEDLGPSSPSWVGTFHGLGVRLLRAHGSSIGLSPRFVIYDQADSTKLMRAVIERMMGRWLSSEFQLDAVLDYRIPDHVLIRTPHGREVRAAWKRTSSCCGYCRRSPRFLLLLRDVGACCFACLRSRIILGGECADEIEQLARSLIDVADIASEECISDRSQSVQIGAVVRRALRRLARERELRLPSSADLESRACREYEEVLHERNALDFDAILHRTLQLMLSEEGPTLASRFDHVLVDEYQDVNLTQSRIALHLSRNGTLTAVGDRDQSIYSWRGADCRLMQEILSSQVTLVNNYRSTSPILKAARSVLVDAPVLRAVSDPVRPEPVRFRRCLDSHEESGYVVAQIADRMREYGESPSDFAVIYRTNRIGMMMECDFVYGEIPYRLYGGTTFYERKESKDLIAYLRLVLGDDDLAVRRVLNVPARGIGKKGVEELERVASEYGGLLGAVRHLAKVGNGVSRWLSGIREFDALVSKLRRKHERTDSLGEFIDWLVKKVDYEKEAKKHLDAETRMANVVELADDARWFQHKEPGSTLAEFLQKVSLVTPERSSKRVRGPHVSLLSAHRAKGLEFPVVFIVGLDEGIFPWRKTAEQILEDDETGDAELLAAGEEERLFYVAASRAKKALYLCSSAHRFGRERSTSRFVKQVKESLDESNQFEELRPQYPWN